MVRSLREEPRLGQLAGALGSDDTSILNGNAQVVADTPALRAGNIVESLYQRSASAVNVFVQTMKSQPDSRMSHKGSQRQP